MNLGLSRSRVGASKVARLAGASMLALIYSTPALADCSPDPAPPSGTVTCTGNDADGYVANTNGANVNVQQGASVSGITAGASATPVTIFINNNGVIQTASNESILGANSALFGINDLTNSATGSIGAIRATVGSLNNYGTINGGTLSALSMQISGPSATFPTFLQNDGTITSNSNSAQTIRYVNSTNGSNYTLFNRGSIINQGSGNAILAAALNGNVRIENLPNGVISSNGVAIALNFRGEIFNEGLIQGGSDAIVLASSVAPGGQFGIGNRGTINGSITVVESGGAVVTTSIYNSLGVINGSVLLGSGNDFLSTQLGNITGTVDGGAGTDTFQVDFVQDTLLSNPLTLPTNFEILNVGLANRVRLTLGTGFALNGTLNLAVQEFGAVGSTATLINRTNLVSNGTAINNPNTGPALTFINEGSITTAHGNLAEAAVRLQNTVSFDNSNSISATGGSGVNLVAVVGGLTGTARNSGTITADGTAFAGSRVNLTNSGTITSNQGIGVALTGANNSSNSGQISGATIGVSLTQSALVNTGTVSSAAVGVQLGASGALDNRAGGVVTGGTLGVQGLTGTANKIVRNTGTINGNVDLGGTTGNSNNTYVAFAGSTLNGNLNLGSGGDRFVTLLPVNGVNAFAGVTGTISGSGRETIVYMVDNNASWVLGSTPAPFAAESFDLANGSVLTLTGAAPQAYNTSFSGAGTVNLNADLTNNAFGPILTVGATTPRFQSNTVDGVRVVSSGTLTTSRTIIGSVAQPAVRVLGTTSSAFGISSFNNTGAINVNDLAAGPGVLAGIAIVGNGRATNRGTINLNGGVGVLGSLVVASVDPVTGQPIYNTGRFTNDGSIVQVVGGAAARGVENIGTVINTGSINTAGVAVNLAHTGNFGGLLDNIGNITSTGSNAVRVTATGPAFSSLNPVSVINQSTGVITGAVGFDAIFLDRFASVDNAGTINGNVKLGGFGTGATYINRGGTLNGNLTFDSGNDVFISLGATNGVTGTINAGAGFDTYAAGYTASATVAADGGALLSSFERFGIGAVGASTVVTVTGPVAGLNGGYYFFGDGTVINQATVNRGATAGANIIELAALTASAGGLSFVNEGNIYDGIFGNVASFDNKGVVGLPTLSGQPIINLSAKGTDTFRFINSGTIAPFFSPANAPSGVGYINVGMLPGQSIFTTANITNSGIINARSGFNIHARDVSFLNSGTINAVDANTMFGNGVSLVVGEFFTPVSNSRLLADRVVFQNTGTINGSASLEALSRSTVFNNSGSISGEPIFSGAVNIYVAPTLTSFIIPPGATQSVPQYADQESLQFINSGSIGGTVVIEGSVQSVNFENSGTINVVAPAPSAFFDSPELALNVGIETIGSQVITLNNSGLISNSATGGSAVGIGGGAGFSAQSTAGATVAINVTNSGSIRANGGAVIYPANSFSPGSPAEAEVNTALIALAVNTGQSSLTINNAANGVIETTGIARVGAEPGSAEAGFAAGDGSVAIIGSANRINFANAGIVNGGAGITFNANTSLELGPEFDDFDPDELELIGVLENRYLPGAVLFFNSIDTVMNTGTINGSVDLGAFDDIMVNYGTVNGDVFLRSGDDIFLQGVAGSLVGAVDGGIGSDALLVDTVTGTGAAFDITRFANFESLEVFGGGSIGLSGALAFDTINLNGAGVVVAAGQSLSTTGPVTITGTAGNERLTNGGVVTGSVLLGAGDDMVSNAGTIGGLLDLGEGNNILTNAATGVLSNAVLFGLGNDGLSNSGRIDLAIDLGAGNNAVVNLAGGVLGSDVVAAIGDDQLENAGTVGGSVNLGNGTNTVINLAGGAIGGSLTLGLGNDGVRNEGTISGATTLGEGNNLLLNAASGVLNAGVVAGTGNDQLQNAGTINGTVDFGDGANVLDNLAGANISGAIGFGTGSDSVSNFGRINGAVVLGGGTNQFSNGGTVTGTLSSGAGNDTLVNSGSLAAVSLGAGSDAFGNSGSVNGAVDLGDGDDTLVNSGSLIGPIDLGAGNDMFVLRSGSSVGGGVSGGAGTDQVTLMLTGTEVTPNQLDFSTFTAFEALRHESGVGLMSGSANFGLIDIVGGRFIGAAGSIINSTNIMVASGATFGSAGTVNGTIIVNGTLSPGASPGTMTVNGNVGFNQGSSALFELTPTISDQLVVNGSLVIASGATLNLTGIRPITPGTPLNLITATGGITGTFGTINKDSSIVGFTRMFNGSLQLLGLFPVEPAFNSQIGATVTYVNNVLQSPQIPAGLLTALPALVTASGGTDTAAFAQLHPEVFASASQIGVENGLALAKAMRASEASLPEGEPGFATFAQGFGNWRQLGADADRGTSSADISSYGVLGGFGFGSSAGSVSLFIGYVDSKQDINTLGSSTDVSGIVAGVSGRFTSGGFHASGMLAYDSSSAKTARRLFNGTTAASKYDLTGFSVDINAGYTMPLSASWSVEPRVGLTHISSERSALSETGGVPFDLQVIERTTKATFVDGELILSGGQAEDARFGPWVSAGVRHQLSGNAIIATGGFVGLPADLTVAGAERSKTLPILGAGFNFALGANATLFADYHGEFGNGTEGQNVNVGVRLKF